MRYPSGKTHLYAILAHPVDHVRAPEFMNPLIEKAGRDGFLVPFHILPEDIERFVPTLIAIRNLKGLIVTIPHKPAMRLLCSDVGEAGRLTGTVNTVRIEDGGRLVGDMFDGLGLVEAARANGMDPKGRSVLIVGCGGAGRAIAFAAAEAGASRLVLANRTHARAEQLADEAAAHFPNVDVSAGPADARGHDLIVQATSLGLHAGQPLPLDPDTLERGSSLFDIIAVRDTELMAAALARGCRVVGGRPMIDHQVAAQIAFLDAPALP